jgi:DMSO/TMAO reductase YedYZ heme-binding membrane subunit
LVKETGVCGENYRPAASIWQTLSQYVVSSIHSWHLSSNQKWKQMTKFVYLRYNKLKFCNVFFSFKESQN